MAGFNLICEFSPIAGAFCKIKNLVNWTNQRQASRMVNSVTFMNISAGSSSFNSSPSFLSDFRNGMEIPTLREAHLSIHVRPHNLIKHIRQPTDLLLPDVHFP